MASDFVAENGLFSIPLGSFSRLAGRSDFTAANPDGSSRGSQPSPPTGASGPSGPMALPEFIAGSENACLMVAVDAILTGNPRYSPLCLSGPTGCGKSHLARGLMRRRQQRNHAKAIVLSGADFARQTTDAVQTDSLAEFRRRLQQPSLLIDNLEQLGNKDFAQQELARLLDDAGRRDAFVVTISKTPPPEIPGLSAALLSRLSGGLSLPLKPPALATRTAILARLAEHFGTALSAREVELLAEKTLSNPPSHLGVLLLQYLDVRTVDQSVEETVHCFFERQAAPPKPTLKDVAAITAKLHRVTQRELCGPTRRQAVVKARGVAMYVGRQLLHETLENIGQHFGRRDHTTVLHACRRIEKLVASDPMVAESVEQVMAALRSTQEPTSQE